MSHMPLGQFQFLYEPSHAFLSRRQGFQEVQSSLIGHGLQHRRASAGGKEIVTYRSFHLIQQQLAAGEQVTASPPTAFPARLMIAKCGA